MSPHAANSLVHDLVQMAQAMEELPKVQAALFAKDHETKELSNEIAMLNADLSQSRTYAATLEQRVHDLEVARDDAELSFLEADERTSRALDFVKALFGNAGALIQALEPPKATPQAEAPRVDTTLSEPHPFGDHGGGMSQPLSGSSVSHEPVAAQLDSHPVDDSARHYQGILDTRDALNEAAPQGQREPGPTSAATVDQSMSVASTTEHTAVPSTSIEEAPPVGPYHGKNYYDWPSYIEYDRWIAGGGTEWDYYNRRERSSVL